VKVLLVFIVILFTNACATDKKLTVTNDGNATTGRLSTAQLAKTSRNLVSSKEDKTIETVLYKISIPYNIQADNQPENSLVFVKDNKYIGGLNLIYCYPGELLSMLRTNHSTVLLLKKLPDFPYEVWQENLEITQPAASNNKISLIQTHIYFVFGDQNLVYDLFFNAEDVKNETVLQIARSFQIQPLNINSQK
jgi:hypothetical protein